MRARSMNVAWLYYLLVGVSSLFVAVVYTVELIYQTQRVGLDPFQLVLAGTVNQGVVFLCQAPTGALADMYSRRRAVVVGLLIIGLGFLIEGALPSFAAILVAQACWGLGASLKDGADAAWLADELGTEKAGSLYLRATQIGWCCTLPGIALGAGLGNISLNLPLLVGARGYLALGLLLAILMPERNFHPSQSERGSWLQLRQTLVEGVLLIRISPVLLSILGVSAFSAIAGEGFGRLWQYHLLHTFTFPALGKLAPITWFGIMETGIALTSIGGIELAHRYIKPTNQRSVAWGLFVTGAAMLLGMALFALSAQFILALAALWLLTAAGGPRGPLTQAWINQQTPAKIRATVLSFNGQVGALAAITGGLLIGAIATAWTTRPAILLTSLLLLPALFLYAYTMLRRNSAIASASQEQATTTASDN